MKRIAENTYITDDGFIWLELTSNELIEFIFTSVNKEIYAVNFTEESEFLIENRNDLNEAVTSDDIMICLEVAKATRKVTNDLYLIEKWKK